MTVESQSETRNYTRRMTLEEGVTAGQLVQVSSRQVLHDLT
jgi:hypothetical protein